MRDCVDTDKFLGLGLLTGSELVVGAGLVVYGFVDMTRGRRVWFLVLGSWFLVLG